MLGFVSCASFDLRQLLKQDHPKVLDLVHPSILQPDLEDKGPNAEKKKSR